MHKRLLAAATLLLSFAPAAHADTLSTITFGRFLDSEQYGFGQSFTIAPGASYNDITFNFYTTTHIVPPPLPYYNEVDPRYPRTPFAIGTGYLLSQQYLGINSALSSSAPGFLGSAVASGNLYTFDPSLTLNGNTQYFFYENSHTPADTFIFMGGEIGGQEYSSVYPNYTYSNDSISSDYLVTGAPVSTTPEPSSIVLVGSAVLAMGGALRRRLQ